MATSHYWLCWIPPHWRWMLWDRHWLLGMHSILRYPHRNSMENQVPYYEWSHDVRQRYANHSWWPLRTWFIVVWWRHQWDQHQCRRPLQCYFASWIVQSPPMWTTCWLDHMSVGVPIRIGVPWNHWSWGSLQPLHSCRVWVLDMPWLSIWRRTPCCHGHWLLLERYHTHWGVLRDQCTLASSSC